MRSEAYVDKSGSELFQQTGIQLYGDCFFVVTLQEKRPDGHKLVSGGKGNIALREERPTYVDMRDVIVGAFSPRHILLPACIYGEVVCVINYQPMPGSRAIDESEAERELEAVLESVNLEMKREFGVTLLFSVSRAHYGVENVSSATHDCLLLNEYRRLIEDQEREVMMYTLFKDMGGAASKGLLNAENACFSRHIHNGDYEAAQMLLNNELLPRLSDRAASAAMLKLHLYRFTDFFIHMVLENGDMPQKERGKHIERLLRVSSISEMSDEMNHILIWLTKNSRVQTKYHANLAEKIKKYIEANYINMDTDVNAIAEHFSISPSYASKVFKYHFGINISYELTKCRVEASKKLLAEGLSIKETAESVGFGNSSNMIRAYKKFEGETPGRSIAMQ